MKRGGSGLSFQNKYRNKSVWGGFQRYWKTLRDINNSPIPHSHSNERKLNVYNWRFCLDFHWKLSAKVTQSALIFAAFRRILSTQNLKYRESLSYPKSVRRLDMRQREKIGKTEMMAWESSTTQEDNTFSLISAYGHHYEVLRCYFDLVQAALSDIS